MDMQLKKRIDEVICRAIEDGEVMGVNLLVKKDGQELLYTQAGMADREKNIPIARDTIFRIYSQTKPVTAAAAMILMERGELDLGAPVGDILPAFAQMKVAAGNREIPCARQLRVNDLLRMSSGLSYPDQTHSGRAAETVFNEAMARMHTDRAMTTREFADRLAACPLAFEPGTSWQYGTSADVLGAVIEEVSGKKFSAFMREEIFEPLHMEDTGFSIAPEKKNRLAATYETVQAADGSKAMARYDGERLAIQQDMTNPPAYEAGGAGLCSTLDDYMKFAGMLLDGGQADGVRIIKEKTVRYLTSGELVPGLQAAFDNWAGLNGFSYYNLMRVCKNPAQACMFASEGEYGWDGWLGTYFANFPKENMTFLIGMQKVNAGTFALTRKLRNLVLSAM